MFFDPGRPITRRRGVVLILILAMMSLLAVVGVMFATLSGQDQVSKRNYAEAQREIDPDRVIDFALEQLINDTDNPASAIRGHSLKRDMYGNDALYNGVLPYLPDGTPLKVNTLVSTTPTLVIDTNIPYNPPGVPELQNKYFVSWALRIGSQQNPLYNAALPVGPTNPSILPAQTFEVTGDVAVNGYHRLSLTPTDVTTLPTAGNALAFAQPVAGSSFVLDGRFMRAFNGTGLNPISALGNGQWANFRYNLASPNDYPMDEDYDAPDLDNWFLALQSADGSVIIPSFHRPGILRYQTDTNGNVVLDDWQGIDSISPNPSNPAQLDPLRFLKQQARILRPRAVDHPEAGQGTFPDLKPDPSTGRITFDVDNDGDGVKDSVWLDLGYPALKDTNGKLYKPLFSFLVTGLNGKLPLNSAGNLNLRNYTPQVSTAPNPLTDVNGNTIVNSAYDGRPQTNHASHLGYSPTEINPKYAFTSATSVGIEATGSPTPGVSFGQFQLMKMLQGFLDANGQPIAGRWGEADLLNSANATGIFPRAGRTGSISATDDDYTGYDFFPIDTPASGVFSEGNDTNDGSGPGGVLLPAERFRNFVTPIDPTGNGRVISWGDDPVGTPTLFNSSLPVPLTYTLGATNWGNGFDSRGRSGFFYYFRPPGMPLSALLTPTAISTNRHNITHGYESFRNPLGPNGTPAKRQHWAAMPWNYNYVNGSAPNPINLAPTAFPTFSATAWGAKSPFYFINAQDPVTTSTTTSANYGLYPGHPSYSTVTGIGTLDRDLPDEMNLYIPDPAPVDAPFGVADLEWLYRYKDIDGSSLQSRLSTLLPESFVPFTVDTDGDGAADSPTDAEATRKRHMFTTDSWDLNNYAWSHDNPGLALFNNNRRFTVGNASASTLSLGVAAPSLAHRGRRINLNYPLPTDPVSANNPDEPIRQKWIRETYYLLKLILPPKATDTPEELAQLSQFVVNIIDFRDPDGTMTRTTNNDVLVVPASGQKSSYLVMNTGSPPAGSQPLVQFGMEYCPVAINEVLAYSFRTKENNGAEIQKGRFFLELINTLTRDNGDNNGTDGTASDLTLEGWDIVITEEDGSHDGEARPDPYTGQLAVVNGTPTYRKTALIGRPPDPMNNQPGGMVDANDQQVFLRGLPENGDPDSGGTRPSIVVLGYEAADPDIEKPRMPTAEAILRDVSDPTQKGKFDNLLPDPASATGSKFYWVYLRRPLFPTQAYDPVNNPMVVVDSMRFPFQKTTGTATTAMSMTTINKGPEEIWSVQRYQPYRGGQAVPNAAFGSLNGTLQPLNFGRDKQTDTTTRASAWIDPTYAAYGYSEQSYYGPFENGTDTDYNNEGIYNHADTSGGGNQAITQKVKHSLNRPNRYQNNRDENWDAFFFHDRDFQSVAELMLVPGCPPGLFTKQFVDKAELDNDNISLPPHSTGAGSFPFTAVPTTMPKNSGSGDRQVGDPLPSKEPHTFPYLVDKFFYTADGQDADDNATGRVGGPTSAGWHKMLEFFEVPAPTLGAIGPVASGENRDWFRQDTRPGQLNLNLIIDEEVFFGLIDDPRLHRDTTLTYSVPSIVTQVDAAGLPSASYLMSNSGSYDGTSAGMKPAFADFLKMRHANPNAVYATAIANLPTPYYILNTQNSAGTTPTPVPTYIYGSQPEAPFHSLSYPDIRYTIMRPADPQRWAPGYLYQAPYNTTPFNDPMNNVVTPTNRDFDNGLMARTDIARNRLTPPPIPPLRLFQIPDATQVFGNTPTDPANPASLMMYGRANEAMPSYATLTLGRPTLAAPGVPMPVVPPAKATLYLGGGNAAGGPIDDNREHPYFRTEWLQKVMNLTTVRTHQYAVWITVGFFEVTKQGNPELATYNPSLAYDQLGPEIGAAQGHQKRYRAFFLVDRTRATGFNPQEPGDYHELVVYRRRIE